MHNNEVRKLPKRTVVIISVICVIAFFIFLFLQFLKEQKITEILSSLGHKNISNVKVVNKLNVEDIQTKMKSSVYRVVFYDNDSTGVAMSQNIANLINKSFPQKARAITLPVELLEKGVKDPSDMIYKMSEKALRKFLNNNL